MPQNSILIGLLKQGAYIPIRAYETGWVQNPALNKDLETGQFSCLKSTRSSQRVQITIRIEPQFRWSVIFGRQLLTGIAQRLEVSNGLRVL